ncbi:MAG TPA: 30S ribosomal protein S4 [Polyangiaceae bacterium]|nr:30S ribosomal protein S4 [Polyangiaceae bacterium]
MARYIGPVCKLCRREGGKLYLKGERCFTDKCAVSRRPYPPGQHGQARIKLSEYGLRLREKQKMRRIYGLLEQQFARYYGSASSLPGRTGEEMLGLIERRLDNVVHRIGFAGSRAQGRQLVRHKHVLVNGHIVNIPSYQVKPNDKIEIHEKSRKIPFIQAALAASANRQRPSWIDVDKDNFTGVFRSMPVRDELNEPAVREQYVVEYYSR